MSINKRYLKGKPVCKVTFTLPEEMAPASQSVYVAGDFNQWHPTATPMKKLQNGMFKTTIALETGREYQFRYLIDGGIWENDNQADGYVPSGMGTEDNSVIRV